jgi:hypothetical protein
VRNPLRKRTALEWVELIKNLPKSWHGDVARVVWWDYFSDVLVADRNPIFDEFLRPPYSETLPKNTAKGLLKLGYTKRKVESRLFAYLTGSQSKGGVK